MPGSLDQSATRLRPSSVQTESSASIKASVCWGVWRGEGVMRNRSDPTETVGKSELSKRSSSRERGRGTH